MAVTLEDIDLRALPRMDPDAWTANPEHRWVYDRLLLASALGYACGPAGIDPRPEDYPVVWKPITNINGMGCGAMILDAPDGVYRPGFLWTHRFTGRHVSTDAYVAEGEVLWSAQALGISTAPDRFALWVLGVDHAEERATVADLVRQHLPTYTGPINVETVGAQVIEMHLRMSRDWIDCGAYDDFPGPAKRKVGVPFFKDVAGLPDWLQAIEDDRDPRWWWVVAPVA